MTLRNKYRLGILLLLFAAVPSFGQGKFHTEVNRIAKNVNGVVGVCATIIETGESFGYNADKRFPIQSVYKFPIAMAILDKVDNGSLSINKRISIARSEYIPESEHSPIRDRFPNGTTLTIQDLLSYNIKESDGTACDVLLRLLGGTKKAEQYIRKLGITDIAIATTEKVQVANDTIQYQNWATPAAMTKLLQIFYSGKKLSAKSGSLLLKFMTESTPGAGRIKGLIPSSVKVAHKTGTSGTFNGLTRATNDVGIISMPDGKRLAISIFISDSRASQADRELVIAKLAKAAFDHWVNAR